MTRRNEIDMTEGNLFKNIIRFVIPLIATGCLQLLYNAADIIVVGKYAGKEALAAVGATAALTALMVNFFMSISVGTSVLIAKSFGARDAQRASRALHTSVAFSIIAGILSMLVGLFLSKTALRIMETPEEILDMSALYLKIYFIGVPANIFYNYAASALRAVGDTKRPLMFLTVSGVVNVILNLFFVIGFDMSVAGVAIATAASQYVSAALVLIVLLRHEGYCRLDIRKLKLHKEELAEILKIGLPAGIQSSVFNISNVIVQSSVNSFSSAAIVAGNSAANNIESFIYTAMYSMNTAAVTVIGQHIGAKKYKKIDKCTALSFATVVMIWAVFAAIVLAMPRFLLSIYSSDPSVIDAGMERIKVIIPLYFLCGLMDTAVGVLRGLGTSFLPMCVSITGVCGIRITWIFTVFASVHTLNSLYLSYPLSWAVTLSIHLICYFIYKKKTVKKLMSADNNI